mmetsp:Transcript_4125/g.10469  ORF Transcript_4125/g.10469 Transcript_4125/m.10469 type:complete len:234 (-) Transcript_4125:192-893(-)
MSSPILQFLQRTAEKTLSVEHLSLDRERLQLEPFIVHDDPVGVKTAVRASSLPLPVLSNHLGGRLGLLQLTVTDPRPIGPHNGVLLLLRTLLPLRDQHVGRERRRHAHAPLLVVPAAVAVALAVDFEFGPAAFRSLGEVAQRAVGRGGRARAEASASHHPVQVDFRKGVAHVLEAVEVEVEAEGIIDILIGDLEVEGAVVGEGEAGRGVVDVVAIVVGRHYFLFLLDHTTGSN